LSFFSELIGFFGDIIQKNNSKRDKVYYEFESF